MTKVLQAGPVRPDVAAFAGKGEAIAVAGLSRRFGAVKAVDSVDLQIRAGEFLSLLGPSGSGKTTLLMMIAGFEMPSAGTIALGARDLTYVPPNKRNIGMVFQRYALFPHMTVAQNVAFPLRMRGVAKADMAVRVERALALVRLGDYAARMPAQLSGGQQQRVAVARALVFEPPVLLMDEPLGALDKKLREELQIEIKKLHQDVGVTIVYVTHDQEEALTMSDRIAVMNKGGIEQIGTPVDLYRSPANAFVADFIGKMNFIDVRVIAAGDEEVAVAAGSSTIRLPRHRLSANLRPATGAHLRLAVRPEHLKPADRPAGVNTLSGRVDTSVFLGSHSTVIVTIEDGAVLHMHLPEDAGAALPPPGAPLSVALDPATLHLFTPAG